jgi:TolB-like protein/Tfp pilus assembly protein PilF
VQWGIAYVAAAWALLQGIDFLADAFHWPDAAKQIATLVLLVGLPVALVLAWFHGDRGAQRAGGTEIGIIAVLLLGGGALLWLYDPVDEAPKSAQAVIETPSATAAATTDSRPSIAVLPFENRSRLEDDAFFVDGIHDDILTQLSKVSAVRVISRTSVEQFRGTKLPMKAIAEQLGVTRILEGGVQRAGDRVRIHVQLIDAATDAHLWAERYDRELTAADIFKIQSEVATAVAEALEASLTPAERGRVSAVPTQSLEAWEAYQLGKHLMRTRGSAPLMDAEGHFRTALALDPKFALASVGLADTLLLQTLYAGRSRDATLGEAEKAANRALELDPNLAEAWAAAGHLAADRGKFERAEQMLRRAIALNANYAPAHQWLTPVLGSLGRRDEALAAAEHASVLDPRSAIMHVNLGVARSSVGRFDDALVALRRAIEIEPTMAHAHLHVAALHAYGFGRIDTAMPWYERAAGLDPGNPENLAAVSHAHWVLGDDAGASSWLARMLATGEGTALTNLYAAFLYLDRGDDAAARIHARRAAEVEPRYLFLMRNVDLRTADYRAARARYAKALPHLFAEGLSTVRDGDAFAAIDLALVLQHTGEGKRAKALLDRSEVYFRTIPRMGVWGYGISDVALYALRGQRAAALAKLREAEQAGWCRFWRYYRDFDPNLASIRNEPEFKAIFADIERDMAEQRARLAARPKDAPLQLADDPR